MEKKKKTLGLISGRAKPLEQRWRRGVGNVNKKRRVKVPGRWHGELNTFTHTQRKRENESICHTHTERESIHLSCLRD